MGNSQTSECSSICGLDFLTTRDLACTSLKTCQPNQPVKAKKSSRTVPTQQTSQNDLDLPSHVEKKLLSAEEVAAKLPQLKRYNTFDVGLKDLKDKSEVNENDFRIMQVSY